MRGTQHRVRDSKSIRKYTKNITGRVGRFLRGSSARESGVVVSFGGNWVTKVSP